MKPIVLLACLVIAASLVCQTSTAQTLRTEVTFARDVAPILNTRCVACHRPGEVAPMSLLSYEEARPYARSIRQKVVARQMPPWFADPNYGSFANDSRLTAKEIDTISKWVDGGALKGDERDLPEPPKFTVGWQLGEPDMIVELPEVKIPATGPDYFPTPSISLNLPEDRWIRAVEIRPGNREVTHHTAIFSTSAGAALIGGSGFFDILAVWAVGTPPVVYPEGMGRWVRKGQVLRTNLHYHPNGKPQVDRTRIGLYFGKGELKKEVAAALAGTLNFQIPPQDPNYLMRAAYVVEEDIDVVSLFPHMHLRGKDMKMTASYPGGREETILNVPEYNFDWQNFYYPKTPIRLPQGTRIDLIAHYDNSSSNPRNPDPTKTVTFGEASTAEMMFGMFEFTAVNGVSPKPGTPAGRMDALLASFPRATAYSIQVPLGSQTLSTVLYLPKSGEGAWYFPALGMMNVSTLNDLVWNGKAFQFSAMVRLGTAGGTFTVAGTVRDDGTIQGNLSAAGPASRLPVAEFAGVSN